MVDRDDTDELPAVTEVIGQVDDAGVPRPAPRTEPAVATAATATSPSSSSEQRDLPARFAGARRRALLWDAGYCMVSGIVLLVLWAAGRHLESLPDWSSMATGVVVVFWAGILVAIAAGGVGRTATALVGGINLLVGSIGFALGWFSPSVPVLAMVVAAQVVGFGLVQLLASVRR